MVEKERMVSVNKKGETGVYRNCELGCSSDFDASHLSLIRACALITA